MTDDPVVFWVCGIGSAFAFLVSLAASFGLLMLTIRIFSGRWWN